MSKLGCAAGHREEGWNPAPGHGAMPMARGAEGALEVVVDDESAG